jgi:hypothetical protein
MSLRELNSSFLAVLDSRNIDWEGICKFDENGNFVNYNSPTNPKNNRYLKPIPSGERAMEEARRTKAILEEALKPPHPSLMMVELKKLSLHCGLQNKAPEEVAHMFDDYIEDLQDYPYKLLREACQKYRLLPEGNNFMPSSGKLVALMSDKYHKLKFLERRVNQILGLCEAEKTRENRGLSLNEALERILA